MREIYSFYLDQEQEVDEVQIKTKKGEEIKTTKKVKKNVPRRFVIKKPSRVQGEEAELFRAALESEYIIKYKIATVAVIEKELLNAGDIYSEEQKKQFEKLKETFITKQIEYNELLKIEEDKRTEQQKKEVKEKFEELHNTLMEINKLKDLGSNVYDRTAESLATKKTFQYLTLILSYEDKDGKLVPVFGEGNYEQKLAVFDQMEEREDKFEYTLIKTLMLVTSFWYLGNAKTKEEFDELLKLAEKQGLL